MTFNAQMIKKEIYMNFLYRMKIRTHYNNDDKNKKEIKFKTRNHT